jgi:hypothetical protein
MEAAAWCSSAQQPLVPSVHPLGVDALMAPGEYADELGHSRTTHRSSWVAWALLPWDEQQQEEELLLQE